jgi:hypothetical protein
MFWVTYARKVKLGDSEPYIDDVGFAYHKVTLWAQISLYDASKPVLSFALMLPLKPLANNEDVLFCVLDKDWHSFGHDIKWTILN